MLEEIIQSIENEGAKKSHRAPVTHGQSKLALQLLKMRYFNNSCIVFRQYIREILL